MWPQPASQDNTVSAHLINEQILAKKNHCTNMKPLVYGTHHC